MTLVIIMGGIDLSVGSIIALSTVVTAICLDMGSPVIASAIAGIGAAAVFGFLNGLFITRLKIVPFITTLGTLLIVRGVAKGLAREQKVDAPITWLVELLASLKPGERWQLVPPGVWLMLFLAIFVALLLRKSVFGRHVFAIGSNKEAAILCGIPVIKVTTLVYMLSGFFAGVAGLLQFFTAYRWRPYRCNGP